MVSIFRREKDAGGGFCLHRLFCQHLRFVTWVSRNCMAQHSCSACAPWVVVAEFCLVGVTARGQVFSDLPMSQSTETPNTSASAASSKSTTGRFCPSNNESAGALISMPAVCSLASNSCCFKPRISRACVTRLPTMFRSPNGKLRVFTAPPPFRKSIGGKAVDIIGNTNYNELPE